MLRYLGLRMIGKLTQKFNAIKNILSAKLLTNLFVLNVEHFKRKDGTAGIGVRMGCDEGYTLRFNFNKNTKNYIIGKSQLIIDSVDFWDVQDINKFDRPSYTVEFFPQTNVLKNWRTILKSFLNHKFKIYNDLNEANISSFLKNSLGTLGFFRMPSNDRRSTFIQLNPKAHKLFNDRKYIKLPNDEWEELLDDNDLLNAWWNFSKPLKTPNTSISKYRNPTAARHDKFAKLFPDANIPLYAIQYPKQQWEDLIDELDLRKEWNKFVKSENHQKSEREEHQHFKNPAVNKKAVFINMYPNAGFPLNSMHYTQDKWNDLLDSLNLTDEWDRYEKSIKHNKDAELNSKWAENTNTYKNPTFNNRAMFIRAHAEYNIPRSSITLPSDKFEEVLKQYNLDDEWHIFNNSQLNISKISKNNKENNELTSEYKDISNGSSDSKEVFKRLSIGLDMLLRSPTQRSMIVVGSPGTGKTHTIKDFLESSLGKVGDKWEYAVLSRISDSQLYETLYRNRDKILVLDEATNFLTNGKNTAVQDMLKSTLQTIKLSKEELKDFYGKMKDRRASNTILPFMDLKKDDIAHATVVYYKTRDTHKFINPNNVAEIIKYCNKLDKFILKGGQVGAEVYKDTELYAMALPERFFYNGKIIFISNNKLEDVNAAIKDRSYVVSVDLNKEGMINRIKEVSSDIFNPEDVDTVIHEILKSNKRISLRTFFSAMNAYATNPDSEYWKIAATL